jgi:hypothetical protein
MYGQQNIKLKIVFTNFDSKNFIKAKDQNSTGYMYLKNKMLISKKR